MRSYVSVLWISSFLTLTYSQIIPYNPTTLLCSPHRPNILYIFSSTSNSTSYQLAYLDISLITSPSTPFTVFTPNLPFQSDGINAFIPSISSNGEISVYTGSCSKPGGSGLWRFTPTNTSSIGNGTWEQETISIASDITTTALSGASFLSVGFSFSTFVNSNASNTNIYMFGGMCPYFTANADTWQSAANYSNNMLRLSPPTSGRVYALDIAENNSLPIAEAGFTIMGLSPTYSRTAVMTEKQDFVLYGGHTESAFINTSQLAVWTLPEESWTFVQVDSPSTKRNTVTAVDSRSGHTAVLTEDGSKIIIYGGWVGDTNQAADPQLVILDLSPGLGGWSWKWTIPTNQPSGAGVYGHGAVLLPGNIMMVVGGYSILDSVLERDISQEITVKFFNATSMDWILNDTTSNPNNTIGSYKNSVGSSSSTKTIEHGVGLGLGLGLAAILGTLLLYFCYTLYLNRDRLKQQEKDSSENYVYELAVSPAQLSSRHLLKLMNWKPTTSPVSLE